jgi:hypothetical protein
MFSNLSHLLAVAAVTLGGEFMLVAGEQLRLEPGFPSPLTLPIFCAPAPTARDSLRKLDKLAIVS